MSTFTAQASEAAEQYFAAVNKAQDSAIEAVSTFAAAALHSVFFSSMIACPAAGSSSRVSASHHVMCDARNRSGP